MTVACIEVPREEATAFGVMGVDDDWRVTQLRRKARRPALHSRAGPTWRWPAWASTSSTHHFSTSNWRATPIDPQFQPRFRQGPHPASGAALSRVRTALRRQLRGPARQGRRTGATSARSMLTGKSNIDLTRVTPDLNMYDKEWPIWTHQEQLPPAKFVFDDEGRRGMARRFAGVRRLHHQRLHGEALAAVLERARAQLMAASKTR